MAGWEPKLDHRLIQMQVCGSSYKTFACIFQNSPSPVKILKISYMFDSSDEGSIWCLFQRCVYCCVFSTVAYIFYFGIILGNKMKELLFQHICCVFSWNHNLSLFQRQTICMGPFAHGGCFLLLGKTSEAICQTY